MTTCVQPESAICGKAAAGRSLRSRVFGLYELVAHHVAVQPTSSDLRVEADLQHVL